MKFNISLKIILIAVAGVVVSSVIMLSISTIMMSRLLTRNVYEEMSALQAVIDRMQQQEITQLRHSAVFIAATPELVDALYNEDFESIKSIAYMTWQHLDVDAVTVTDDKGIVLARGHADLKGDDISARSTMSVALNGIVASGVYFEETAVLPYAIRCYTPIFKDGVQLGVLTLGTNIGSDAYVDNMRQLSGMHFSLFSGDTYLTTSIKDSRGIRLVGAKTVEMQIVDSVLINGETVILEGDLLGEPNMKAFWPITDVYGEIVGMWAIAKSLSNHNAETNRVLAIVIFCSLGVMLLLVIFASITGRKISLPIREVTDFAVQVADGNLEAPLDAHSRDEVGFLIGAINTMVGTLKDRINDADAANRAKSDFLSTMSHEIRTPMNAILGITEMELHNKDHDMASREAFERIHSSGDLLLGIINDILDLSKIEAGKLDMASDKYEIASLISDAAQINMMRIGSKRIEFEIEVDEHIPAILSGDELRIKQILNNLLSNSFKYTSKGMVKLSVRAEASTTNTDEVDLFITVSDTGSGMTKEEINKLFDEYSRFNKKANRAAEGTGLGMSITKNLIRIMNGDIHIESEPGVGSTFTVRLPQLLVGSNELGKELAENLQHFRTRSRAQMKRTQISREHMPYGKVLIVDDVETNLYVAEGLLSPYGLDIETVDSGYGAIDNVDSGKKYDIIFMDHMMPGMNGIETTKHLRELGYDQPIVALTADAVAGQADMFLKNGFDAFISKPIDIRQLNMLLNKLIRDKQAPEVIEEARKQADINSAYRKSTSAGNKITLEPPFDSKIEGLNITKGLEQVEGDKAAYIKLLRSYISSVRSLLETTQTVDESRMVDYKIAVHGVRGASNYICAFKVGSMAEALEEASGSGDIAYVRENNPAYLETTQRLISDLNELLQSYDAGHHKPKKAAPDPETLSKLLDACKRFDMDDVDEAMEEIEKYQYESDDGLVDWLKDTVAIMDLSEIVRKLDSDSR